MVPIGGRPAHSLQTTSTLALAARRLSDKKLVDELLRKNMAQNASELAQTVGIVSPVTSAVVLENDSQYFNFGIEPRAHRESRESLLAQSSAGADSSGASMPSLNFARSEIVNQLNSLNTYTPAASTQLQGAPTSPMTNSLTIGTQEAERQRSQGNPLLPFQITLAILFLVGLCISIKLKLRAS